MQMKIKPGQYIQKISEPDEEMKSLSLEEQKVRIANKVKNYLVLSVDNQQADVLFMNGTPPLDSQVLTYDEVAAQYDITEIPLKNVKLTPIYRYCKINSVEGMYEVALKHEWNGKEFTRPIKHSYWNGSEWADSSEFWNSMEDVNKDDKHSKD